jgi:cytosine/adenosine deaminase-related metal-dependent hydrolase
MWPRRTVSLVNAQIVGEGRTFSSIRFAERVRSLGIAPQRSDTTVDLDGDFIFPGLVNAHDHLEHNHFGRVKWRETYADAAEWIEDMRPRLHSEPGLVRGRSYRLADRLLCGGLKNLLSGTTLVAHHNPFYRELRRDFPVRLVRRYGWAHSFYLQSGSAGANGEPAGDVRRRHHETPAASPFMLHLAEGTSVAARSELARLEALGCLSANALLVHGLGLEVADWERALRAGAGLAWCPASNTFLFGRTLPIRQFLDAGRGAAEQIALGTDSRLTGSSDLLAEMRLAKATDGMTGREIFRMVTTSAARVLGTSEAGRLSVGGPADLIVVPRLADDPYDALLRATRKDLRLVMIGGRPLVGAPELAPIFIARHVRYAEVRVDGAPKVMAAGLVDRLLASPIGEPGFEIAA